ncbi:hypothetical protein [Roseibacillus persicicus]|uniref:hypothetical protein n=1 Tax=Roseibacillus persicicus TaxID=454148 RepID=UPI00280E2446|nr:hypothetical protein [Roseibacillus persicicus]MDQ8192676.1 hypothetical protein [Roseibacillus persicicus]
MNELIVSGSFLVVVAWLIVEFRLDVSPWSRVILGLLTVFSASWSVWYVTSIVVLIEPSYEREFHRSAITQVGELLQEKRYEEAEAAIFLYNHTILETESTYDAAMRMLDKLNSDSSIGAQDDAEQGVAAESDRAGG